MNFPTLDEVLSTFLHHVPNDEQIARMSAIREAHKALVRTIWATVPGNADRTAAMRKIHESMMTCNKAIVNEVR